MSFALGGTSSAICALQDKGLVDYILDTQDFDQGAAAHLFSNPHHIEIDLSEYANTGNKGAYVNKLDYVVLSALEIDTKFNVNVITGSDGVLRGAPGGHPDTAAGSKCCIIVTPLTRGRMATVFKDVVTVTTPGDCVDVLVTFVAHLDGSGATTFLIVVPAFLPIIKRLGFRKEALLAIICGPYAVMNIVPWGGPTMRAATVAEVETGDLYSFIMPGVIVLAILAFVNGFLVNLNEVRHGLKPESAEEIAAEEAASESSARTWKYWFNLALTLVMLVFLFLDTPLPLYSIFMIAYAIALLVNFPQTKTQNKKIKELGQNAMVMTVTLFSVGIFMGVISGTGMVDAMATTIVNILPAAMAPHMHWFMALFSVPLMMILGTDAFYYALLPIIGVVAPFGVSAQAVAATFLLTATFGTPVSPSVAAVYVGLGLADVTIGDHIKYSLKFVWPMSILTLIASTLLGVIPF